MIGKSNDYISICLGDDVLKVAIVKGAAGATKLSNVYAQDVKGLAEDQLIKAMQAMIKKLGGKKLTPIFVVPSSMTTTKNIEIPSTNPTEIESIVNLQAGRHTPFSREEIQIGYINLGVTDNNYSKVLLVIVNKKDLTRHLGVLEKAGLKVKKVMFAPEGISSFYSKANNLANDATPSGIIDIGKYATDFVITFKGLPITSRNIPVGHSQLQAEGDAAKGKLVDELQKTIEAYQSEDIGESPTNYILASDDGIQSLLKEKLNWDATVSPYVDIIKTDQKTLVQLGATFGDISFLGVTSSATVAQSSQINLLPEEVEVEKSIEAQTKSVYQLACNILLLLIVTAAILGPKLYFQGQYLKKMKEQHKGDRTEVVKLETLSKRSKIIYNFLETRMVTLDVLHELYDKLDSRIYLTSLFLDDAGTVNIQGISEVSNLVYKLATNLKSSELFTRVDVKSTTDKKDRGESVTAFEIALKLSAFVEEDEQQEITLK